MRQSLQKLLVAATAIAGGQTGCRSLTGHDRPPPAGITDSVTRGQQSPLTDPIGYEGPLGPLRAPTFQPDKSVIRQLAADNNLLDPVTFTPWMRSSPIPVVSLETLIERESRGEKMLPMGSSNCAVFVRAPAAYRNPNFDPNREIPVFVPGMPVGSWVGFLDNIKPVLAVTGDCIAIVRRQPAGIRGGPPIPAVSAVYHATTVAGGQMSPAWAEARDPGVAQLALLVHHLHTNGVKHTPFCHSEGASILTLMQQRYRHIVEQHTGRPLPAGEERFPLMRKVTFIGAGVSLYPRSLGERLASFRYEGDPLNGLVRGVGAARLAVLPFSGRGLGYAHKNTSNTAADLDRKSFGWHRKSTEGITEIELPGGSHTTLHYGDGFHAFYICRFYASGNSPSSCARTCAENLVADMHAGTFSPPVFERAIDVFLSNPNQAYAADRLSFARALLLAAPTGKIGNYTVPRPQMDRAYRIVAP